QLLQDEPRRASGAGTDFEDPNSSILGDARNGVANGILNQPIPDPRKRRFLIKALQRIQGSTWKKNSQRIDFPAEHFRELRATAMQECEVARTFRILPA